MMLVSPKLCLFTFLSPCRSSLTCTWEISKVCPTSIVLNHFFSFFKIEVLVHDTTCSLASCLFCFVSDARDREQLARNNITHILSIHDSAAPILKVRHMHLLLASSASSACEKPRRYLHPSRDHSHRVRPCDADHKPVCQVAQWEVLHAGPEQFTVPVVNKQ